MVLKRLRNILGKEWEILFSDPNSAMTVVLLPFLIIGQGLLYVWLAYTFGGEAILNTSMFQSALEKLRDASPAVAALSVDAQSRVLLLSQFTFFLLLIPTMVAISSATFSIVDEKQSLTLEPLLATPVRTWELLLGKTLAGALPAIGVTWVCSLVYLVAIATMGWTDLIGPVLSPSWFLSLFLLTPATALLSFMLGVIGSSRAKDARSAQNTSIFIILPVFAIIAVQVMGLVWFTAPLTLALAAAVAVADFLTLRLAVRLFQRESIIVNWK